MFFLGGQPGLNQRSAAPEAGRAPAVAAGRYRATWVHGVAEPSDGSALQLDCNRLLRGEGKLEYSTLAG